MSSPLSSYAPVSTVVPSVSSVTMTAPAGYVMGSMVGVAVMSFIIVMTFAWVILYSFNPKFVRMVDDSGSPQVNGAPDPARCFIASLIVALLVVVVTWMFRSAK